MKLRLERRYRKSNYCIGKLYINDKYFSDVLEDPDRDLYDNMSLEEIQQLKIKGDTCIPYGTYNVTITYSPKFKRNLPLINNVKGFEGIRIHEGNSSKDTQGCPLLGFNKAKGRVLNSKDTVNKFITIIQQALNRGENVTIEVCKYE